MRKRIIKILSLVSVIICAFSLVGCFSPKLDDKGTVNYSVVLKDSEKYASTLSFVAGNYSRAENKYDQITLASKIRKYSVAIESSYLSGNKKNTSTGSGVIIDIDDGIDNGDKENNIFYIVTCHHVIASADDITLYLPNSNGIYYEDDYTFTGKIGGGKTVDALNAVSLIGGDAVSDIAVLKLFVANEEIANYLQNSKAPFMDITKYSLSYGEDIATAGNSYGEPGSFHHGTVSYERRVGAIIDEIGYMELIQHDVLTSPGDSGGGVYNYYGELVGIQNAGSSARQSINFAIPLSTSGQIGSTQEDRGLLAIIKQLMDSYSKDNYGYISRRWSLGVVFKENTSMLSNYVSVYSVAENSNGYNSELKENDIINSITLKNLNGELKTYTITSLSDLNNAIGILKSLYYVGESFSMEVSRTTTQGRYYTTTTQEVTINISNANYIFADTGVYTSISQEV